MAHKYTQLEGKLAKLLEKRDAMHVKQMDSYRNGTATRSKTTTMNKNIDMVNDEIIEIREFLKESSK